jgi:flagellar biosynthetic protein FliR
MIEVLQELGPMLLAVLPLFALVVVRVGGLFVFSPVLGDVAVPVPVRAALALLVAAAVTPVVAASGGVSIPTGAALLGALILECLVGLAIGFAAHAYLAAAEFAGSLAGYQGGLDLSRVLDPITGVQISLVSNAKRLVAVMVFLALDGHHLVLRAVAGSYQVLPPGAVHLSAAFAEQAIGLTARLLAFGLQIAAPVLATTLITDLVLLLVGRAVPQIQILLVGYPLKLAAGLVGVALALTFFLATARPYIEGIPRDASLLIDGLGAP